jgi:hypothetical protein
MILLEETKGRLESEKSSRVKLPVRANMLSLSSKYGRSKVLWG